jgi:hypothetical protein
VFGDESADETQQRVFAVGGVIGDEARWKWLEERWDICNEGTPFHATDCDSDGGNYRGREHATNKNLYKDLTILLAASGLGGWGFAIDLQAQRRVFPRSPDIAYYRCFLEVIKAMRNCAAYNKETVKYTFDMRPEDEYKAGYLYGKLVEEKQWKDYLFTEISFACSRKNTRVQIADLFTREVMKAMDSHFGPIKRPPRKSWRALVETGRFHAEAIGQEWFEDLKKQLALHDRMPSPQEYTNWLAERQLKHSTWNMYLFLEWRDRDK